MKVLIIDDLRSVAQVQTIQSAILSNGKSVMGTVTIPEDADVMIVRGVSGLRSLKETQFDIVFLDHDLGDFDPDTNLPYKEPLDVSRVLPTLNQRGFINPETTYVVHSMNPIGRKNIVDKIKSYLKE